MWQNSHEGNPCEDPICVNCKGNHSARFQGCPIYKQEKAIQEIMIKEKKSYFDAKKKVIIPTPTPNLSFSSAVSRSNIDVQALTKALIPTLIPQLVSALQNQKIVTEPVTMAPPPPPKNQSASQKTSVQDERTQEVLSDSVSEKRKRHGNESSVSTSEDETTSDGEKRKRGWPKGKARKPPEQHCPTPRTNSPPTT